MNILVLVNGDYDSAPALRARGLFELIAATHHVEITYRRRANRLEACRAFIAQIHRERPDLLYVMDCGVANAIAALVGQTVLRVPFILDTGDLVYELARVSGMHGRLGRAGLRLLETLSVRLAAAVVVRGTYHRELLSSAGRRAVFLIRDGVHRPAHLSADKVRTALGLGNDFTVGMVGSVRWNSRFKMCYGWELIDALSRIDSSRKVTALIIGDGDGLPRLISRAAELGVSERVRFLGRIQSTEVWDYLAAIDVAISTQADTPAGWVRTTGKLPMYMAAGRYIVASDVGEARLLLPQEMRLEYHGVKDASYPGRLAAKLSALATMPGDELRRRAAPLEAEARDLSYPVLASRLLDVLEEVWQSV